MGAALNLHGSFTSRRPKVTSHGRELGSDQFLSQIISICFLYNDLCGDRVLVRHLVCVQLEVDLKEVVSKQAGIPGFMHVDDSYGEPSLLNRRAIHVPRHGKTVIHDRESTY